MPDVERTTMLVALALYQNASSRVERWRRNLRNEIVIIIFPVNGDAIPKVI